MLAAKVTNLEVYARGDSYSGFLHPYMDLITNANAVTERKTTKDGVEYVECRVELMYEFPGEEPVKIIIPVSSISVKEK